MSLLLYHVSNDRGESASAPNAARLSPATPGRVTFADVLAAFPLAGAFHFRFQVLHDKQLLFLDIAAPVDAAAAAAAPVPTMNGNVVAKVLRLDALKSCAGRAGAEGLALRPLTQRPRAPAAVSAPRAATPAPAAAAAPSTPRTPVAVPAAFAMPVMAGGGSHHEVPKEVDGDVHIRDDGLSVDIYAKFKTEDARGMRPVRPTDASVGVALPPPAVVDADLEGKSDFVKASVMARRAEVKAAQEARLAEVTGREATAADDAGALDVARATHGPRLREWAREPGGGLRNIRGLITTLPSVLWEGAKWEPVPMAKLVVPARVRAHFLRAVTVVHPDKAAALDVAGRFIAGEVFHALEEAFRAFQEAELS